MAYTFNTSTAPLPADRPSLGVKLGEEDLAALSAIEGAGPFGPAERPMGGYLSLPPSCTAEEASRWVGKAQAHVGDAAPQEGVLTREEQKYGNG